MGPNALEVVRSNSACILLEHGEVEQQIHRQSLQRLRALTSTRSSTPVRTFGREPSAQSRRVRWSSAARSTVCSRGTRRWSFVTDAALGGGRWFRRSWGMGGRKTRQVDGTAMVSTLRMSWIPATDEPCQGLGDNMRGVVSSYQFPLGAGGSTGRSLPHPRSKETSRPFRSSPRTDGSEPRTYVSRMKMVITQCIHFMVAPVRA